MRAIDADVMLAELKPIDYEAGHRTVLISDVAKIMREWVERQPTLTPPNEWVSVEEGLPKPDIDVLLYFGDSAKLKMAVGGKYELDDGWYSVTDGEYYTDCDTPPIYWMPLPEEPDRRPPEGEADA
jgi:hypothetical protein